MSEDNSPKGPNFLQVMASALAAVFGVQSSKNRERDFQHGSLGAFAAAGVVAVILFVLLVYGAVRLAIG